MVCNHEAIDSLRELFFSCATCVTCMTQMKSMFLKQTNCRLKVLPSNYMHFTLFQQVKAFIRELLPHQYPCVMSNCYYYQ